MNWKRASEITEPGAYWVDDRRPDGKPSPSEEWYVAQVDDSQGALYSSRTSITQEGMFLKYWNKNIYLYGPIHPPERESK